MLTNTMRTRLWQGSLAQPFSVHKNISGNEASFTRCAIGNGKIRFPAEKGVQKLYEKR